MLATSTWSMQYIIGYLCCEAQSKNIPVDCFKQTFLVERPLSSAAMPQEYDVFLAVSNAVEFVTSTVTSHQSKRFKRTTKCKRSKLIFRQGLEVLRSGKPA